MGTRMSRNLANDVIAHFGADKDDVKGAARALDMFETQIYGFRKKGFSEGQAYKIESKSKRKFLAEDLLKWTAKLKAKVDENVTKT